MRCSSGFFPVVLLLVSQFTPTVVEAQQPRRTENVLLVTLDGLRWQELFYGADRRLISREEGGVRDVATTERAFWRETPAERREALMPWFWSTIARHGQVFGSPEHNCPAVVTNGKNFSYPGYNEILAGLADPRIDSNDKRYNPNVTVLEFLNARPPHSGRVAAVTSWDVFPWIINAPRSGVLVHAGWQPIDFVDNERTRLLNESGGQVPRCWPGVRYDWWTCMAAKELVQARRPSVLYVAFDETDDWAHDGRYDLVLDAAHRTDEYLRLLWTTLQGIEQYAGRTSLVITTDHGRGDTRDGWKSHGAEHAGSERIWIAVMGPDTPALGLRRDVQVTQSQVAATVAELLGEDFRATSPQAAPPLPK
jgi:hypothetical protein